MRRLINKGSVGDVVGTSAAVVAFDSADTVSVEVVAGDDDAASVTTSLK